MSGGVARGRLAEERKSWRKNHPHGFVARPDTMPNGSANLMTWRCVIPGKPGAYHYLNAGETSLLYLLDQEMRLGKQITDWEGGFFPLTIQFSEDYPNKPPTCIFPKSFFHLNVYANGIVCLSILSDGWTPSITVRQILLGVQELLDNPNPASAAQCDVCHMFTHEKDEYRKRVRLEAKKYPAQI